jgi:hypothetical protein
MCYGAVDDADSNIRARRVESHPFSGGVSSFLYGSCTAEIYGLCGVYDLLVYGPVPFTISWYTKSTTYTAKFAVFTLFSIILV